MYVNSYMEGGGGRLIVEVACVILSASSGGWVSVVSAVQPASKLAPLAGQGMETLADSGR